MRKKRVYVESSVISYLAARPSTDIVKLTKQTQTRMWWERRDRWDLFISPAVIKEIQGGDQDAARKRIDAVSGLPILHDTDTEAEEIALLTDTLIRDGVLPGKARFDALHIANATIHGMDYLVTWNQKHIFNLDRVESLFAAIRRQGCVPPVLVRPDYFLETSHGS